VGQHGMFRADADDHFNLANGTKSTNVSKRVYDNHQTKSLVASKDGAPGNVNLIKGRADDIQIVRPHTMLTRMKGSVAPLSAHLRGADAIRAYPYGSFSETTNLAVEYQGEGTCKGLRCHVVKCIHTVKSTGKEKFHSLMWIAEDKNYIPVRYEAYDYVFSRDVPVLEGEATEWKELKPGIWFPMLTSVNRYDSVEVKRSKRKKLSGKWTYKAEGVSLDPKYDLAYFQDLTIPNGTSVYEVQDKKIIRSYREGQPGMNPPKSGSWLPSWLMLWGNMGVVVISGAFVVRKRLRRAIA
jgi:hypothetical protein